MAIRRQELFCTECHRHVQFDMDFDFDGNHQITCPNCGHFHYRVVVDGRITEDRYNPFWEHCLTAASNVTSSTAGQMWSTADNSSCAFLADSWYSTTGG